MIEDMNGSRRVLIDGDSSSLQEAFLTIVAKGDAQT